MSAVPPELILNLPKVSRETLSQIRVVKRDDCANIPNRRASALKRLADIESELGRLTRLVVELRADVLHLTTE